LKAINMSENATIQRESLGLASYALVPPCETHTASREAILLPSTYHEQPEVQQVLEWKNMFLALGVGQVGVYRGQNVTSSDLTEKRVRIEEGLLATTRAIGNQVLDVLCTSPVVNRIKEFDGRSKGFLSLLGKIKRREDEGSEKQISDIYGYWVCVEAGISCRGLLHYIREKFGIPIRDVNGDKVIQSLANRSSDRRFVEASIPQGKFYTEIAGEKKRFEVIVMNAGQRDIYKDTRPYFEKQRPRDNELVSLIAGTPF
jgi:hypothetical protein